GDEGLKVQVAELQNRFGSLNIEFEEAHAEAVEARKQEKALHEELSAVRNELGQARLENDELLEMLRDERVKNSRNEADFRLFSKKIKTLQDANTEMRQEAEQLRSELR
ncbi:hypothetical protein HK097_006698, partial [Rhizophlyctis rosea]